MGAPAHSSQDDALWPTPLHLCLLPFSWLYGLIVRLRVTLYRLGVLSRRKLPCRVISIGNLTVGGTGKTPVVIAIVSALLERGVRVGVLSRGYRRSGSHAMVIVSDGHKVLVGPDEGGDEPVLIAHRCPRAVVAVGADRFQLGQWMLSQFQLDVLVLDDGFQHVGLDRDIDLLLLDAGAGTNLRHLLPAGRLREPLAAASRASALVLTRCDHPQAGGEILSRLAEAGVPARPTVRLRFFTEAMRDLGGRPLGTLVQLKGRRGVILCALANPQSLRRDVEGLGVTVVETCLWPDHHTYTRTDVEVVLETVRQSSAEVVLTTEKDAVKLAGVAMGGSLEPMIHVLRLGVEVLEGQRDLDRMLAG